MHRTMSLGGKASAPAMEEIPSSSFNHHTDCLVYTFCWCHYGSSDASKLNVMMIHLLPFMRKEGEKKLIHSIRHHS